MNFDGGRDSDQRRRVLHIGRAATALCIMSLRRLLHGGSSRRDSATCTLALLKESRQLRFVFKFFVFQFQFFWNLKNNRIYKSISNKYLAPLKRVEDVVLSFLKRGSLLFHSTILRSRQPNTVRFMEPPISAISRKEGP